MRQDDIVIVIAQLTMTPARLKLVDFSNPSRRNINEIVVTGPGAPAVASAVRTVAFNPDNDPELRRAAYEEVLRDSSGRCK